jgi:uracil-DNA glycosylase
MANLRVVLALGRGAHAQCLRALHATPLSHRPFAHGARHDLPAGPILADSYHCSRYNTNTGRLTPEMFSAVVENIRAMVD